MTATRDMPALAVLAPVALVAALAGAVVLGALVGWQPFWPDTRLTVAEAAYVGDVEATRTLLDQGAALDVPAEVGGDVTGGDELALTPLQASAVTDRVQVTELLVERGVPLQSETATAAACLAEEKGATTVLAFLADRGVSTSSPRCAEHVGRLLG